VLLAGVAGLFGCSVPATTEKASALAKDKCKGLDCVVEASDGVWHATFEGGCTRPYKYAIKMDGRQVGGAVLLEGATDLGAQGGGIFDWVGRATDDEFVGFFTSSRYMSLGHGRAADWLGADDRYAVAVGRATRPGVGHRGGARW
jgi:hypothetical protein